MVSQKQVDNIINKHASIFKALEEFEKTGKTVLKSRMNFTIDRETAKEFKEFCKNKNYNMSSKIEEAMKKLLGKSS